ncbi:disease resistance protein RGA2-like [Humulus lupulus]|uniref:disease resistance protein RGA2-like n=1 Tax=Humulus lupulus TaxID=3486 RepID=UPI002B407BAA|nr:disease resistance protein RGA2-like [Humulus lupulus]
MDAEKRQVTEEAVRDWLDKLKDVSYDADDVLDEWITRILVSNLEQDKKEKTTSFVDLSKVYGRDEEKKVLIRKLLSKNSSQDGRNFDIIPIVGMSGIGKIALAQLAFNDAEVQAYFDKTIWICVSEPFDEVVIAKAIIESLERRTSDKVEIQSLLLDIEHSIKDRRFLLVLDDVWTKDDRKWESIERVLANGAVGSRILVTTQKEEVVKMMRAETDKITVEFLSEEFCWDMLR